MTIRVLAGDCRALLATLPDASVQCVVTSPPYYGLRDYGTAQWDGGDAACDHSTSRSRGDDIRPGDKQGTSAGRRPNTQCKCACGARRVDAQIGLEATPDDYIAALVGVFREVKRVLRPDGVLFLNLGDSYASGEVGRHDGGRTYRDSYERKSFGERQQRKTGTKPKDLLMIPARVALALQADGWWLRSAIIWHKPNPMPESVTDRPTSSYEHVFLLAKSARYYWDADAVREPHSSEPIARNRHQNGGGSPESLSGDCRQDFGRMEYNATGRNIRNVWTIATSPYRGAHYAVMPPALAERCIKAGSKPGDTILDPFGGAGTTGLVADRLGRNAVLIELSPGNRDMARERIVDDCPLFAEAAD